MVFSVLFPFPVALRPGAQEEKTEWLEHPSMWRQPDKVNLFLSGIGFSFKDVCTRWLGPFDHLRGF